MFILFGSPRSGTTLLAGMLAAGDRVIVPEETDFIVPAAFVCDRVADERTGKRLVRDLVLSSKLRHSVLAWLSEQDVADAIDRAPEWSLAAILNSLYGAIAGKSGRPVAGDKSPNDLLFVRILEKVGLFDDAGIRVIHLVRDVRAALSSLRQTDWAPPDLELHFPRHWCASNLHLSQLMRWRADRERRYHFLRYEDLVREPEERMRRIASFLDVPFQSEMLDPARRAHRAQGREHHRNLGSPVQAARADAWRDELPEEIQQLCLRQAREAIEEFGYTSEP